MTLKRVCYVLGVLLSPYLIATVYILTTDSCVPIVEENTVSFSYFCQTFISLSIIIQHTLAYVLGICIFWGLFLLLPLWLGMPEFFLLLPFLSNRVSSHSKKQYEVGAKRFMIGKKYKEAKEKSTDNDSLSNS